jgi:hypothetical protein
MSGVNRQCRVLRNAAALATWTVLALAAAPASADQPPVFTTAPTIAGNPTVGGTLRVVAAWSGMPAPTPVYEWQRCDVTGMSCTVIGSTCTNTYAPTFDDFGQRILARVDLFNPAGVATANTPLSDLILGGASPATPTTTTTSCAASSPPPAPSPAPSPPPPGAAIARVAYLQPFPVVRIRGYATRRGMRITLLSVRGPRSASVSAACAGAGCPHGVAFGPRALPVRLRAFERYLAAGTVLRLRVTGGTAIGKYTSFRIRARRAPRRIDRCLLPGRWAPAACPER